MGFSRQEYWSRVPFPTPGNLPNPGIQSTSLVSPALAGRFFNICATWEAPYYLDYIYKKPISKQVPFTGMRGEDFNISLGASRGLNSTHNSNISKKLAYSSENHLKEEIKVTLSDFKTSFKVKLLKLYYWPRIANTRKKFRNKCTHIWLIDL